MNYIVKETIGLVKNYCFLNDVTLKSVLDRAKISKSWWNWNRSNPGINKVINVLDSIGYELVIRPKKSP